MLARGEVHDPELAQASITVAEARVTPDLRHATVFVLPLGGVNTELVVKALGATVPYPPLVTAHIDLKFSPQLAFEGTRSFDAMDRPLAARLARRAPRPRRLTAGDGPARAGRPVHGWRSSTSPRADLRRAGGHGEAALDAAKAGHAGTLDLAATGLLAVAFGEATKTVPYVTAAQQILRFAPALGAATATNNTRPCSPPPPRARARPRSAPRCPAPPAISCRCRRSSSR